MRKQNMCLPFEHSQCDMPFVCGSLLLSPHGDQKGKSSLDFDFDFQYEYKL